MTTSTNEKLMANNRPFKKQKLVQSDSGWNLLNRDVVQLIAARHLSAKDTASLAQSCQQLWQPLQPVLNQKLMQTFLQAVIDDDRAKVIKLLNDFPALVKAIPAKDMVIESRCTWQKLMAEDALSMAVKRKQLEMIQLLAPYHDKADEVLSAWSFYEMDSNAEGEETIVITPAYVDIIQNMITVFTQETFTENKCCAATDDALSQFRDMLLPEHAVNLDNYFDIELLLYAAFKLYNDRFDDFQNWEQRDAFCIGVIGFIESLVTPETAKIFCEGLYYVVEENRKIKARATLLKLLDEESFYHSSRESRSGLGFDFICEWRGGAGRNSSSHVSMTEILWKSYVKQKQQNFETLRSASRNRNTHSF
jgi:hypothetical protein